jgi:hypothetical protein
MPRMKILTQAEQELFDIPPVFSSEERKRFFNFPLPLLEKTRNLRKPASCIGFPLSFSYFKANKRFFKPQSYHQIDVEYVSRRIEFHEDSFSAHCYTPPSFFILSSFFLFLFSHSESFLELKRTPVGIFSPFLSHKN